MFGSVTEIRNGAQALFPVSVIYGASRLRQTASVWTTKQLLTKLDERGIKNADVARVLDVSPSRITELRKGEWKLSLDHAAKIVEHFGLVSEPAPRVPPLPAPVSRLIVQYIADELGVSLEQRAEQLQELSQDVRAFSEFVSDRANRESVEAAEYFFQAMRLRRPANDVEDPQQNDPAEAP